MKRTLAALAASLVAAAGLAQQGLTLSYYANQHATSLVDPLSNLLALTPTRTSVFTGAINLPDPSASLVTQADNYTVLWSGWFVAPTTGTYTFRTGSDDGSLVYIDLDGDGVFESGSTPSERIVNNNFYQGVNYREGTVTLAAQAYRIAIPFYQGSGGEGMYALYKLPGDAAFTTLDTASGLFLVNLYPFEVAASAASDVGPSTATLNGTLSIFSAGDFDVWAAWSTNDWGEAFGDWQQHGTIVSMGEQAEGAFSHPITGLASNTVFYYRFFATNDIHSTWSDPAVAFKTLGAAPGVDNASGATGIGGARAFLNGRLTAGSRADCRIYLGTTDGVWTQSYDFGSRAEGAFSVNATGLALSTTYYYRTFASNAYGTAWAPSAASFTTASSSAETLIWNGSSGDTWNDDGKWLPSYGIYPQSFDTAVLSNHVAGGTINLNGDQAVWRLDFGSLVNHAIPGYTISGNTLTIGEGGIHQYGRLNNATFNSAIRLATDSIIAEYSSWPGQKDFNVNGAINNDGHQLTLHGGAWHLYANASVSGAGPLLVTGGGTVHLRANNTFTGPFTVAGGNAAVENSSGRIGATPSITLKGGSLTVGNSGNSLADDGVTTFGRVPNDVPIAISRAATRMKLVGQSNVATTEKTGTLAIDGEVAVVEVGRNGSGSATIDAASLARNAESRPVALVYGSGYLLGSSEKVTLRDGGASMTQIGGDGSRSTNKKVVPYLFTRTEATFANGYSRLGGASGFVTYDAANGLTQLNPATDYVNATAVAFPAVNPDGNDNVRLPYTAVQPSNANSVVTLTSDTVINSLLCYNNKAVVNDKEFKLNGARLTIKSGLIMGGVSASAARLQPLTINVATTDFANAEGVLVFMGPHYGSCNLATKLVGSKGLTIYVDSAQSGDGLVYLTGDNTNLTGQVTVINNAVYAQHLRALGAGGNDLFLGSGIVACDVGVSGGRSVTVKSVKGSGTISGRYNSPSVNIGGSGTGGAASTLTLLAGGTVAPGQSGRTSTLTVSGFSSVKLSGGTVELDLEAASSYDRLALSGTPALTINGASLVPKLGYLPAVGDTFLALTVAGSTAIAGAFAEQDAVEVVHGTKKVTFDILYNSSLAGGTGNDVVLRVANVQPAHSGTTILIQ